MALAIRMRQQGRSNGQTYRVVLTDERSPRDGKYAEQLGWYNPRESEMEKQSYVDAARVDYWIKQGAKVSERVQNLLMRHAPEVIKSQVQREVASRAKTRAKIKARAEKSTEKKG